MKCSGEIHGGFYLDAKVTSLSSDRYKRKRRGENGKFCVFSRSKPSVSWSQNLHLSCGHWYYFLKKPVKQFHVASCWFSKASSCTLSDLLSCMYLEIPFPAVTLRCFSQKSLVLGNVKTHVIFWTHSDKSEVVHTFFLQFIYLFSVISFLLKLQLLRFPKLLDKLQEYYYRYLHITFAIDTMFTNYLTEGIEIYYLKILMQ